MGGSKKIRKHIPYKEGQVLFADEDSKGRVAKIKILKYNGNDHYKILVYFYDAHEMPACVIQNAGAHSFKHQNFSGTLSETLKRL